jgi:hypothetical protein
MKKIFPSLALLFPLILLSCGVSSPESIPTPTPTSPPPTEIPQPYAPQPEDSSMKESAAFLDSMDLLQTISPPEIFLHLSGYLPTPCHALRVDIAPPDAENNIAVRVYSVVPPDTICEDVLRRFDVKVNLGVYPAGGRYTVFVNGERVGDFLR